jgi:hypothetical protein
MKNTLQSIRAKFKENGYRCRKFSDSDRGFVAKSGKTWWRVWFVDSEIRCQTNCTDWLHVIGIKYMIEREMYL